MYETMHPVRLFCYDIFSVIIIKFLILPVDHLSHLQGLQVVRGPQVENHCCTLNHSGDRPVLVPEIVTNERKTAILFQINYNDWR